MTEQDYIEWNFVLQSLKNFGFELKNVFTSQITSKQLIRSGTLNREISFSISRSGEKGGEIKFYFPTYGRMIEIQYFKPRKNRSDFMMEKQNRAALRGRGKTKKDTRWYTRSYYGLLNGLIGELMYGFTEAVKLDLIQRLVTPYKQ